MKRILIFLIILLSWNALCFAAPIQDPLRVELETKDGVTLFGLYQKVTDTKATIILLPMLSKTKGSWSRVQKSLAENGYASFAVDLRGHGESLSKKGREISWKALSNKEFAKMIFDVDAVYNFLVKKEKIPDNSLFLMGASIGANVALKFATENKSIRGVMLLSPGFDYRGVETVPAAKKYGDRPILLAASREDMSSYETIGHLAQWMPNNKLLKLDDAGHGTTMFERDSLLLQRVLLWLEEVRAT